MFKVYTLTIALFVQRAVGQIAYSNTLKCGECIRGGYNYCFVGKDGDAFVDESGITDNCCEDTSSNCRAYTDMQYTCSGIYSDASYAKTFCPQVQNKCDIKQNIEFGENDVNTTQSINIRNLNKGETCTYKVKSKCNAPAFRVVDGSGANDSSVEISFIEYKKSYVKPTSVERDQSTEDSTSRRTKQPDDDKPPRN